MRRTLLTLALVPLAAACTYQEGLEIHDLQGKVVLPEAAGTRTTQSGNLIEDDVRLIGPVYLGLYPSVQSGTREYPYPEIGPSFQTGVPGDTYPYGGTTVGDLRYACFEFLTCKVISGRYVDFDDLVQWFNEELETPIVDAFGNEVTNGEYFRQTCFDLLEYTSDEEIRITATEDVNGDGKIDELDLDFVQRNDGKFEADFTIYQQEWFEGFSMWGWMDAPSETNFRFSTCDPDDGFFLNEYNEEYYGGRQFRELLNFPSNYIGPGDWVPAAEPGGDNDPYVWDSPTDVHEIELGFQVEI